MAAVTDSHETVGLKANAVNLWGDFVVSIANVAPSSSVAFLLGVVVRRVAPGLAKREDRDHADGVAERG